MKDLIVHLNLSDVWSHAESDFQTFVASGDGGRPVSDFSEVLEYEPEFFQDEWTAISLAVLARLPCIKDISLTTTSFRVTVSLPDSSPEGVGAVLNNVVRSYAVKRLVGAWNELRLGGLGYEWRGEADRLLDQLESLTGKIVRGEIAPRRITHFP